MIFYPLWDIRCNSTTEHYALISATSIFCHSGFVSQIIEWLPLALKWESDTLQLWRPLDQITFGACCLQQLFSEPDAESDTAYPTHFGFNRMEANSDNSYNFGHIRMISEQWDEWSSKGRLPAT